jgi:hypothetical protein
MSHIYGQRDRDLHWYGDPYHAYGEHRSTPPTANGKVLESHERRIRAHLALHQARGETAANNYGQDPA